MGLARHIRTARLDTRSEQTARGAVFGAGCEPGGLAVLHFINNNDTGKRFISVHGVEQTRLAAVLLFTLPGIPLIYAGDEAGAQFEPYSMTASVDTKSDVNGLRPLYTRLTHLRRAQLTLRKGSLELLDADRPQAVLAFARGLGTADPWIVVLNFGASPVQVRLHRPVAQRSWSALDPLTGTDAPVEPSKAIDLPRYGAALLHLVSVIAPDQF